MVLKLERIYFAPTYTIGKLYIDGVYFCDTLEDTNRDSNKNGKFDNGEVKVHSKTCIPFGRYEVIMTLSTRFGKMMPLLLNVPNFEGVRMHSGNTDADTEGCILVGKNTEKGKITESRTTTASLYEKIEKALKTEKVFITIK